MLGRRRRSRVEDRTDAQEKRRIGLNRKWIGRLSNIHMHPGTGARRGRYRKGKREVLAAGYLDQRHKGRVDHVSALRLAQGRKGRTE